MEPNEKQNEPNPPMSQKGDLSADTVPETGRNAKLSPPISERKASLWGYWFFITAVLIAIAVTLTFTLTAASLRKQYAKALDELQIRPAEGSTAMQDAENFKILESVLQSHSFYADTMDPETMLRTAFKAYVAASGDRYAVFYNEEEYRAMNEATSGQYVGIGVSFQVDNLTIEDENYTVFRVLSVQKDSSAAKVGIYAGDSIFAVKTENGQFPTIESLGYDAAVAAIRGDVNTSVELAILRPSGSSYETFYKTCVRERIESISAEGWILQSDPTVGVIRVSEFDLNTPVQFCRAVDECRAAGAEKFVFDLRDNPGGDLRSVRAILSNFLREGDLILKAIDKDGNVSQETRCGTISYMGDDAGCSVSKAQIGQYRDLDFVVLCNENTASAAEVFTATLRDFGLSRSTVGKTTFGKGIMQTIFEIPFKGIKGYIKLTTHAYVTECGESYHGVGISPDVEVERLLGTETLPIDGLTWEQDIQLQTAVAKLTAVEE